jgi:hypothetical protein
MNEVLTSFAIIFVFGVLLYFMFITRRTVLRIFGYTIALFITIGIFRLDISPNNGATMGAETTKIINDLRTLCGATIMFYKEFKTWPSPGQEASLDAYCDRPMVFNESPRYAKVMLAVGSGDANTNDTRELYVGVELIPKRNGMKGIQKKLAGNAPRNGLLQQPVSGDIYKSGLRVYMQMRIH